MAAVAGRAVREGSLEKRAAILSAARDLFLEDGFERTSMDAIALRAEVSKRTVYDYYGDKRALLLAVVEQALGALMSSVSRSIDENLQDVHDIEASLTSFARAITDAALGSSDYSALIRLVSMESANLPELRERLPVDEPETLLAERFAAFGRQGLLEVPNPRRAADHFVALTLANSASSLGLPISSANTETNEMIVDGVQAFLRAYKPLGEVVDHG